MKFNDVLNNRNDYVLVYSEPWPGITADGEETTIDVKVCIGIDEALAKARLQIRRKRNVTLSDEELLDFFIVYNYATIYKRKYLPW